MARFRAEIRIRRSRRKRDACGGFWISRWAWEESNLRPHASRDPEAAIPGCRGTPGPATPLGWRKPAPPRTRQRSSSPARFRARFAAPAGEALRSGRGIARHSQATPACRCRRASASVVEPRGGRGAERLARRYGIASPSPGMRASRATTCGCGTIQPRRPAFHGPPCASGGPNSPGSTRPRIVLSPRSERSASFRAVHPAG